jgi:RimJ/RimL family protein N-acetyltransferase
MPVSPEPPLPANSQVTFARKPVLTGDLVVLRPVTVDDAPGLVELLRDPEGRKLTGTHGSVRPGVEERARSWYGSRAEQDDQLYLAITERATGQFLGEVVLENLDAHNRSCTFRIALVGQRAYGHGFGSEATALVLGHAFEATGVNRVELEVHDFNPRARHVYERAGFAHEGTKRQALLWEGQWIDTHIMAVLASDWASRPRSRSNPAWPRDLRRCSHQEPGQAVQPPVLPICAKPHLPAFRSQVLRCGAVNIGDRVRGDGRHAGAGQHDARQVQRISGG